MKILKIIEPEDDNKCCRMECLFEPDELEVLLSYAVTNILRDQIKKMEADCEQRSDGD